MRLYEPNDKLSDDRLGEPSKVIRQRVEAARVIQQARFEGKGLTCNADMGVAEVREFCGVDGAGAGPAAGGDDAVGHERPVVSPDTEAVADDRGFGGD